MTTRREGATYDYRDADGEIAFQVVRYEPKEFSQRKPKNGGGYVASVEGCPVIPYRLPEILEANPKTAVFVVEGEKDVDRLAELGIVATCNSGGAGKWKSDHARLLATRDVVIIPDNDDAGRKHAATVAQSLNGLARSIKIVDLPDAPEKGDVSDWLDAGGKKASLLKLVHAAPTWTAPDDADGEAEPKGGSVGGNRASQLVGLAESVRLFRDKLDRAYAHYPVENHCEVAGVRSTDFRNWLQRQYFDRYGQVAPSQPIHDALGTLEAQARFSDICQDTYVRVAGHDGKVYVDLADADWRVIEIDDKGWRIINNSPVMFRRPRGMLPLPNPVHGGSISELQEFVNIDSAHWPLYAGALVAALWPTGPYPLMAFIGEKGRAKSTTSRATRALVDPNSAPLRSFPHGERDFVIGANNAWVLAFDNVSHLSQFQSDLLCRMSTGSGFSTRALYHNDEEAIFDAARPVLLNGISDSITSSDLLDRSLIFSLPPIDDENRVTEAELWQRFDAAKPRIFGALLNAVSCAIRNLDGVNTTNLPRMADFARLVVAAEPALDLRDGDFLLAYRQHLAEHHTLAIESSQVGTSVLEFTRAKGEWEGSASELLDALREAKHLDHRRGGPRSLADELRRVQSNLAAMGARVEMGARQGKVRKRLIRLVWTPPGMRPPASASSAPKGTRKLPRKKTAKKGPKNGGRNGRGGRTT